MLLSASGRPSVQGWVPAEDLVLEEKEDVAESGVGPQGSSPRTRVQGVGRVPRGHA